MPAYTELEAEVWWRQEYAPASLLALGKGLRTFFSLPADAIGVKGNNLHLRGYHRSYAWLRNSRYCTDRSYSTSETPGNRAPGDPNWLAAIDITLPGDKLIPMCRRLDDAVRAGRLEKVTEWYGNDDGDNRVDGFDNIRDVAAASDDSHLWHAHLSLDRGRVNEDHTDLLKVLTGVQDMAINEEDFKALIWRVEALLANRETVAGGPLPGEVNQLRAWAGDVRGGLTGLMTRMADLSAMTLAINERVVNLQAGMAQLSNQLAAVGTSSPDTVAILAGVRDIVADLGEGGAERVRADG
jgi:hypothetical protein